MIQTGRRHRDHHVTIEQIFADVIDGPLTHLPSIPGQRRCPVPGCPRQTFREQVPGVLERYQRRTTRLTGQVSAVARELAGRAGTRLLSALGILVSRHTALWALLQIPLPALAVPRVLGIDDFALRRGLVYATVLIDAETGRRVDVIPGRTADVAEEWLRGHPGVEVVCRDGPGAYGEAVRRALPGAVQVSDRWHLRHGLGEAVRKEVAAHSGCWAGAAPLQAGKRAETTLERWQQVHDLLGKGVGLLECARRLDLALNTVKRYARAERPERLQRTPQYRPTLVDPYRDHLRRRRAEDLAVPVQQLAAGRSARTRAGIGQRLTCSSAISENQGPRPGPPRSAGRPGRPTGPAPAAQAPARAAARPAPRAPPGRSGPDPVPPAGSSPG